MANDKAIARQTLRVVKQEALLHDDDGDILLPLKRVRDLYMKRAAELDEKMPGIGASDPDDVAKRASVLKNADFYHNAANAVQFAIGVMRCQDFTEASAPIDQTELIASDISESVTRC